ncbi:MAG: SulP family inorganic anion transporter [Gemmatimonadota bacterium]|nr:SulP family inorganic anion transporter [Gemmatimonadota bacterium]
MSSHLTADDARFPRPQLGDLIAGISVAVVLIPQSLAYARLAGMPLQHGLYAALLPTIAAAFFVSSPYLQTGPGAMTSLLTFGALSVLAVPGTASYVQLAAVLAIVVGVVRVAFGWMRWGWVAYLMSQPVLTGFASGAAILIIASQVPTAVGVDGFEGGILRRAVVVALHPGVWEPAALGLSLVTLLLVLAGRRLHPVFPGVLVAVVVGLLFSWLTGYTGPTVGAIPSGLPPIHLALPWSAVPALVLPGLVIALVGFAEPAAIARTYALLDRKPWSPDREFVSQGVANLAAGLTAGFPVGGSFARTSVNRLSGGRTRWSGAVTGLVVLAFLPMTRSLGPLPQAVLGAVVIAAVVKLIAFRDMLDLARFSLPQAGIAWATFFLTLVLAPRIDQAVIMGIGLAGVVHIWRELQVHVQVVYADRALTLELEGVLFFGSAPALEEALVAALADHPEATRLILRLDRLGRIDYTGAVALRNVADEGKRAGLEVELRNIPARSERVVRSVMGWETR